MKPQIATDAIALTVTDGVPVRLPHGMGRQVEGWLVIWQDAAVVLRVQDAAADSSKELVLVPSGSGRVRVVLL